MSGDGARRARGRERARRPVAAAGHAETGAEDAHHFRGTYRSTNSPASFCMLRERLWSPPQRREDGPCPRARVRPRPAPTRDPGRHPAQAPTHARPSPSPPRPAPPQAPAPPPSPGPGPDPDRGRETYLVAPQRARAQRGRALSPGSAISGRGGALASTSGSRTPPRLYAESKAGRSDALLLPAGESLLTSGDRKVAAAAPRGRVAVLGGWPARTREGARGRVPAAVGCAQGGRFPSPGPPGARGRSVRTCGPGGRGPGPGALERAALVST